MLRADVNRSHVTALTLTVMRLLRITTEKITFPISTTFKLDL